MARTPRNLVLCLDGTRNEPEAGLTNVTRLYDIAVKDDQQLVYYDPGVGTMGARSAITGVGKTLTRVAGMVIGYGIKENIEEAYRFLMDHYRPGDQVFLIGFSRGAYTARALAGMLRTVGLLRPGADPLIPYALKLYAQGGHHGQDAEKEKQYWELRAEFNRKFGNPAFPYRFARQVAFLGAWDTVKTVGWLNLKAQFEQARWPFTRKLTNVERGRHAIAVDERRRPYPEYRFHQDEVNKRDGRLREMWFAGVHSDVGGVFEDHRLSDIALQWMTDEAVLAGLRIDEEAYERHVTVARGSELPREHVLGEIHANGWSWGLLGLGWHHRKIRPGDEVHPSVRDRMDLTNSGYHPDIPDSKAAEEALP